MAMTITHSASTRQRDAPPRASRASARINAFGDRPIGTRAGPRRYSFVSGLRTRSARTVSEFRSYAVVLLILSRRDSSDRVKPRPAWVVSKSKDLNCALDEGTLRHRSRRDIMLRIRTTCPNRGHDSLPGIPACSLPSVGPVEIPNRLYFSPHGVMQSLMVSDEFLWYFAERAAGGVGLLVHSTAEGAAPGPGVRLPHMDEAIPAFARVANIVHGHGSRIFARSPTGSTHPASRGPIARCGRGSLRRSLGTSWTGRSDLRCPTRTLAR